MKLQQRQHKNWKRIDLNNALKVLNKYGTIIIHDTDPIEKFLGEGATEDSYKIIDYIESNPELSSVTIQANDVGMTIVKRRNDRRVTLR